MLIMITVMLALPWPYCESFLRLLGFCMLIMTSVFDKNIIIIIITITISVIITIFLVVVLFIKNTLCEI